MYRSGDWRASTSRARSSAWAAATTRCAAFASSWARSRRRSIAAGRGRGRRRAARSGRHRTAGGLPGARGARRGRSACPARGPGAGTAGLYDPARFELVAEVPRLTSGRSTARRSRRASWPRRPNPAARTTCPPPPASRRCSSAASAVPRPAAAPAISSVTWAAIRCWPRGWCPRCASIRIFRADHARAVPAFHAGGAGGAAGRAGGRAAVAAPARARAVPERAPEWRRWAAAWRSWRRCPS